MTETKAAIPKIVVYIAFSLVLVGFVIVFVYSYLESRKPSLSKETPTSQSLYKGVSMGAEVALVAENIPQVTDIEISPDGNFMLIATLPGKVYALHKKDGVWLRQRQLFFDLNTSQPGFPPEEAGLTGIILDADFNNSHHVFLNHSFSPVKKQYRNRVTRVSFSQNGDRITGENPKVIFEANTDGGPSHQIQDGVGLMISGKPHILFSVGEGFKAEYALDLTKEAGKLILIQSNGDSPVGTRPYDNLNIQGIGIRNAPDIAFNVNSGKLIVADTGPSNYDRLVYGKLVDLEGKNLKRFNFNWNGTEESLKENVNDPFESGDMVIYRWKPTKTAVALNFYDNPKLPGLPAGQYYVLVTLFGQTGSTDNKPGKEILLGTITEGRQDRVSFKTLVEKTKEAEGKVSHPIGTAVDPVTKAIYFGDLMEGKIYKVTIGGGLN